MDPSPRQMRDTPIEQQQFLLSPRQESARTIDFADDISREATLDRTDKISRAANHSFQLNELDGRGAIKVYRSNGVHPLFFDTTPL